MTLHLEQLVRDIEQLGQSAGTGERAAWLEEARQLLSSYDPDRLQARLPSEGQTVERLFVPLPLEPLHTRVAAPDPPMSYTVVSADGSNIAPDRDNPAYYYVLNMGMVTLRYGMSPMADIRAHAQLYYKPADLYWDDRRLIPMDNTRLSLLMRVEEMAVLPDLVAHLEPPCVVLVDGQLVMWGLQNEQRDRWGLRARINDAFDRLRDMRVPIVGYISNTESFELINTLRLYLCAIANPSRCEICHAAGPPEVMLCHHLNGVRDPAVLFQHLQTEERSGLFASQAAILQDYTPANRIVYFYYHTGDEIARIEVPRWVVEDEELLALTHGVITDQCRRTGRQPAYPPILHEAHEAAVISMQDRENVQRLIEQQLQKYGQSGELRPAKTFHKRLRSV